LHYKVSCKYDASDEGGVNWGDVDVGVVWPIDNPIIATRDASYPNLKDLNFGKLPNFKEEI
jgi:dTDP-4-dehydrorhamnose 3,5-epimerase